MLNNRKVELISSVISSSPLSTEITQNEDPYLEAKFGNPEQLDQEICQTTDWKFAFTLTTNLNIGDHILLIFL